MDKLLDKYSGFTLLELIITIAIVGIIASFAIPSYQHSIMASQRIEAKSSLLTIQLEQEKWRAAHVSYATLEELQIAKLSLNGLYELSIPLLPNGDQFFALATPIGKQQQDSCGTFALNQLGAVYKDYANQNCWGE
ncbi:MAG: type IV pilin protein [Pseudomonadota bacterium]